MAIGEWWVRVRERLANAAVISSDKLKDVRFRKGDGIGVGETTNRGGESGGMEDGGR